VIRFFVLNWLIKGLSGLIPCATNFSTDYTLIGIIYNLFPLIYLCLAFLGWKFAPKIASFLTQGIDEPIKVFSITNHELYQAIFIGVGLWYFLENFPTALQWLIYMLNAAVPHAGETNANKLDLYDFTLPFISLGAGIICILFSKRFSDFLIKKEF